MESLVIVGVIIVLVIIFANSLKTKNKTSEKPSEPENKGPIRNSDKSGYITFIPNVPEEFQDNFEVPHLDGRGGFDYLFSDIRDQMDQEFTLPDELRQHISDQRAFRYFLPEHKAVRGIIWQLPCAFVWHHDAGTRTSYVWLIGSFGKRFAIKISMDVDSNLQVSAELTDDEVNIDLEEDFYFNEYKKRLFAFGDKKLQEALSPLFQNPFFVSTEIVGFEPLPKATLDFFRYCKKQGLINLENFKDQPMMSDTAQEVAKSLIKGEKPRIPTIVVEYEDDDQIISRQVYDDESDSSSNTQPKAEQKETQWAPTSGRNTPISDDISVDENGNLQTKIVDGVVVSKDNFSVEVADGLSVHKDGYTTRVAKGVDVHSDGRTTVDVLGSKVTLGEKKKDWKDGFFDSDKDKKKGFFD